MCHRDFCIAKRRGVAMREIARNRIPRRLVPGFGDSRERANHAVTACAQHGCCVAAANDNQIDAWPERLFHMNDKDDAQRAREVA